MTKNRSDPLTNQVQVSILLISVKQKSSLIHNSSCRKQVQVNKSIKDDLKKRFEQLLIRKSLKSLDQDDISSRLQELHMWTRHPLNDLSQKRMILLQQPQESTA